MSPKCKDVKGDKEEEEGGHERKRCHKDSLWVGSNLQKGRKHRRSCSLGRQKKKKDKGKTEIHRWEGEKGRGVKFPSGFQLGRINSVLELTLTPRLPPLLTGQVTCTHSRGLQRDSDCITASLTAAEVAENGTIKKGESERKTETGAWALWEAEWPAERWLKLWNKLIC